MLSWTSLARKKQLKLELGLLVLIKEENQSDFGLDFIKIGNQYDVLKTGEAGGLSQRIN